MRIRQVRPEFWSDPTLARLPDGARLFYIGLWNVADDAGWLTWDEHQLGALLYPYRAAGRRERDIHVWSAMLISDRRLVIELCGCAQVPTLAKHQKIGGTRSFPVRDAHQRHRGSAKNIQTDPDESARNVRVGNVTVGNGRLEARLPARESETTGETEFQRLVPKPS